MGKNRLVSCRQAPELGSPPRERGLSKSFAMELVEGELLRGLSESEPAKFASEKLHMPLGLAPNPWFPPSLPATDQEHQTRR